MIKKSRCIENSRMKKIDIAKIVIGMLIGFIYIGIMFDFKCEPGKPPRTSLNTGSPSRMVHVKDGSIFLAGRHLHHWMICVVLIPIFILVQFYIAIGMCITMTAHGLCYNDAFVI